MDLLLLFIVSLLAATLFPAQSEAVLIAMHLNETYNTLLLIAVATFGNVLGSCINWLLGRYMTDFRQKRWFPVKTKAIERAERIYKKYGIWTLLFAWVPMIGDSLTLIAGFLRTPILPFTALVTIGKAARYVIIVSAI